MVILRGAEVLAEALTRSLDRARFESIPTGWTFGDQKHTYIYNII
jgi:hypothetical protein